MILNTNETHKAYGNLYKENSIKSLLGTIGIYGLYSLTTHINQTALELFSKAHQSYTNFISLFPFGTNKNIESDYHNEEIKTQINPYCSESRAVSNLIVKCAKKNKECQSLEKSLLGRVQEKESFEQILQKYGISDFAKLSSTVCEINLKNKGEKKYNISSKPVINTECSKRVDELKGQSQRFLGNDFLEKLEQCYLKKNCGKSYEQLSQKFDLEKNTFYPFIKDIIKTEFDKLSEICGKVDNVIYAVVQNSTRIKENFILEGNITNSKRNPILEVNNTLNATKKKLSDGNGEYKSYEYKDEYKKGESVDNRYDSNEYEEDEYTDEEDDNDEAKDDNGNKKTNDNFQREYGANGYDIQNATNHQAESDFESFFPVISVTVVLSILYNAVLL